MKWLPFIKTLHLADWITHDRKPRRFITAAAHHDPSSSSYPGKPRIGSVWPEFPDHCISVFGTQIFWQCRTLRELIEVGVRMPDIVGVRAAYKVQRRAWPGTNRKASNKWRVPDGNRLFAQLGRRSFEPRMAIVRTCRSRISDPGRHCGVASSTPRNSMRGRSPW